MALNVCVSQWISKLVDLSDAHRDFVSAIPDREVFAQPNLSVDEIRWLQRLFGVGAVVQNPIGTFGAHCERPSLGWAFIIVRREPKAQLLFHDATIDNCVKNNLPRDVVRSAACGFRNYANGVVSQVTAPCALGCPGAAYAPERTTRGHDERETVW